MISFEYNLANETFSLSSIGLIAIKPFIKINTAYYESNYYFLLILN